MQNTRRMVLVLALLAVSACFAARATAGEEAATVKQITGAGASFPYPLYSKWGYDYMKLTGLELNYQSIGSGGGIKMIKGRTVDFGASDKPLTAEELQESGLVQFPMIIGGVVPVVNIKGLKPGELRLAPDVMADIFMGAITEWRDPRIAETNGGVSLPDTPVIEERAVRRNRGV